MPGFSVVFSHNSREVAKTQEHLGRLCFPGHPFCEMFSSPEVRASHTQKDHSTGYWPIPQSEGLKHMAHPHGLVGSQLTLGIKDTKVCVLHGWTYRYASFHTLEHTRILMNKHMCDQNKTLHILRLFCGSPPFSWFPSSTSVLWSLSLGSWLPFPSFPNIPTLRQTMSSSGVVPRVLVPISWI